MCRDAVGGGAEDPEEFGVVVPSAGAVVGAEEEEKSTRDTCIVRFVLIR